MKYFVYSIKTIASSRQVAVLDATPEAVGRWLEERPEVLERVLQAAPSELLQRALASRVGPGGSPAARPPPADHRGTASPPTVSSATPNATPGPERSPERLARSGGDVVARNKRHSVTSDLFQMWLGASPIKRSKSPSRYMPWLATHTPVT